jgi:CHAT domain-containing protein
MRAVLVAESDAPKYPLIHGVEHEVRTVAHLLESASARVVNDVNAEPSVQSVLNDLPTAHILHMACHGHQEEDALQSCFALRDGSLSIASLMSMRLPHAMLAFLSACETAKGGRNQPDQAAHLAASMLFCGFRSVVGTMWCAIRFNSSRSYS